LWGARAVSSEFWPFTEYSNPNAEEGNRLKVHKPKRAIKKNGPTETLLVGSICFVSQRHPVLLRNPKNAIARRFEYRRRRCAARRLIKKRKKPQSSK